MRIREVYDSNPDTLKDYTKQDSMVLNIQRAIEAAIDIGMFIISDQKLGIPQNSRDAFEVLYNNGILDKELLEKLKKMVGFRNIAVHNYQKLNIEILQAIIEEHLDDLKEFIVFIAKSSNN